MSEIKPFAPGSNEAVNAGCTCPTMDNGYGSGSGYKTENGDPLFWYNFDCPLHGKADKINNETRILEEK